MDLVEQITNLISQPYGSMAYHLLISFVLISILHPALGFSMAERTPKSRRMLGGIGLLILLRLALFVISGYFAQGYEFLGSALPVLDRIVNALSLVIIIWLWAFQEPQRRGDVGTIIGLLLIIAVGILSIQLWGDESPSARFTKSELSLRWGLFTMAIALGAQLLIYSKAEDRTLGFLFFLFISIGEILQIIVQVSYKESQPHGFPLITRVTYMAAFPLLLGLARRMPLPSAVKLDETVPVRVKREPVPAPPAIDFPPIEDTLLRPTEPISKGLDLKLYQTTLALASVSDPDEVCQLLTMYTAHALVADLCLLFTPPDANGQVHLICGYDLIVEESLSSTSFDHQIIPGFANLVEKGRPLQIPTATSDNLRLLADLLYLDDLGNFLAFPIANQQGKVFAVLGLISPYSKFVWTADTHSYLKDSAPIIAKLLQRAWFGYDDETIVLSIGDQLKTEQLETEKLREENQALAAELAVLSAQNIDGNGQTAGQEELLKKYEASQATLNLLQAENQELGETLAAIRQQYQELSTDRGPYMEDPSELLKAQEQVSSLQSELQKTKQKISTLEASAQENGDALPNEQADVIASIAQELRQPMSSISGYTDLLISESVGILGALQKKFLERVKASTERMNNLIRDLVQITTLDSGNLAITLQDFEMGDILDQAIEMSSSQLREKNIILRVDISNHLPKINTDKDALQQILHHLLQNAGAATPLEGEIFLRAEPADKSDPDIINIQVTDTGEGIPKEDLARVFSRLHRADNPLIQGVGDTGVGLSIAKTLTDALGGRIWVESEVGIGSTFSVLLPVDAEIAEVQEG